MSAKTERARVAFEQHRHHVGVNDRGVHGGPFRRGWPRRLPHAAMCVTSPKTPPPAHLRATGGPSAIRNLKPGQRVDAQPVLQTTRAPEGSRTRSRIERSFAQFHDSKGVPPIPGTSLAFSRARPPDLPHAQNQSQKLIAQSPLTPTRQRKTGLRPHIHPLRSYREAASSSMTNDPWTTGPHQPTNCALARIGIESVEERRPPKLASNCTGRRRPRIGPNCQGRQQRELASNCTGCWQPRIGFELQKDAANRIGFELYSAFYSLNQRASLPKTGFELPGDASNPE